MRIAFIGTRGIPNNYGGFEQFAEYVSVGLAGRGHRVTVFNPHFHPFAEGAYKGVEIRKIYCPEKYLGSAAHFLYDFLSLRAALREGFDVIYAAGYGTLAPSLLWYRKVSHLVVNMDGLEWKRSKWNAVTKRLMKACERMTVRYAGHLVSDNEGIRDYYLRVFKRDSTYMAYGADPVESFDPSVLGKYGLGAKEFYLCIARMEPENNIETILDGYILAGPDPRPFVVIGNYQTRYGRFLYDKYRGKNVRFLGPVYDKLYLDNLRHFARLYFHGHSVGGTNPSLLEAMAAGSLIAAHDNPFNRSVLNLNAFYFSNPGEIRTILSMVFDPFQVGRHIENNYISIRTLFSWQHILNIYETFFRFVLDPQYPPNEDLTG